MQPRYPNFCYIISNISGGTVLLHFYKVVRIDASVAFGGVIVTIAYIKRFRIFVAILSLSNKSASLTGPYCFAVIDVFYRARHALLINAG